MVPIAKAGILTVLIGGGCVGTYALANGGFGSKRGNEETAKANASENKVQSTPEPDQPKAKEGPTDKAPSADSGRSVKAEALNVVAPEVSAFVGETNWKPLTKDSDYSTKKTTDYNNKFGSIYGNYFVGLDASNKDWWDKSFEQLKTDSQQENPSLGEKFKYVSDTEGQITSAFSSEPGGKGLNQICNEVYKSDPKNITSDGNEDNYKESDVWKYCSPLGEKPKTIATISGAHGTLRPPGGRVGVTDNTTKFISTTGNARFWEIRDKEFKGDDGFEKIEEDSTDSFFKQNKSHKIKDLCGVIYGQTFENITAPRVEDRIVFKYCSLEKR